MSSNGGAKTELLGPPWKTETQTRRSKRERRRSYLAAAVGLLCDFCGINSATQLLYDVHRYKEDDSDVLRTLPGLVGATTALIVTPQLSPTLLETGIPRHRAPENCRSFLLAPEPHPKAAPNSPKTAVLCSSGLCVSGMACCLSFCPGSSCVFSASACCAESQAWLSILWVLPNYYHQI